MLCALPIVAVLALAVAPAAAQDPGGGLSGSRPNILFVFSDDHATHALSAYGSRINETPSLDRLADEGALFRNSFCGNSICGPSRATILTGKHCHENGFMRNGNRFDPHQTTFPVLVQEAGYQTAVVGKWHLGTEPVGFDHWIVLPGQGRYYDPHFETPGGRTQIDGYTTDIITDLAIDWLEEERDPDRPFVLMCQHKAPHRSWMPGPGELSMYRDTEIPEPETLFDDYRGRGPATRNQEMEIARHMRLHYDLMLSPTAEQVEEGARPARWWQRLLEGMSAEEREAWNAAFAEENRRFHADPPTGEERVRWMYQRYIKNYLRCVAGVDESVGRLLAWLEEHPGVAENTIVVYSSDQGFYLGDHGWYDKRWMYEESLRMPLLMRWPERIAAGTEIGELVQNIDFAPTFLDLAGVEVPGEMHGRSLVPLLEGEAEDWRDAIYYHYYESHAVHMVGAHYGVRTDRYKLMYFYEPENDYWELYDLEKDPDELTNVAGDPEYAEVRARLEKKLEELRERYGDDTGVIAADTFDVSSGVARAVPTEDGWHLRTNHRAGYLLRSADLEGPVTFSCTMRPADPDRPGDGFIVLTGGLERRRHFRAGIDFAGGRLLLMEGSQQLAAAPIEIDPGAAVTVEATADLESDTLTARAGGEEVRTELPEGWSSLTAWGYGASTSETVFGKIERR